MSKNYTNPTKVITGVNTRWSYANVWDPKSINGGAPKYSVSLIIPKSDTATVNKIKAAIQSAYEEGESKLKGNGKSVPALSILSRLLFVTEIWKDLTMQRMQAVTSSMPTLRLLPVLLMQTVSRFLTAVRCTAVYMAVHPSTSMPSIPMGIRVSPAV